jgi:hypothetical protein
VNSLRSIGDCAHRRNFITGVTKGRDGSSYIMLYGFRLDMALFTMSSRLALTSCRLAAVVVPPIAQQCTSNARIRTIRGARLRLFLDCWFGDDSAVALGIREMALQIDEAQRQYQQKHQQDDQRDRVELRFEG